MNLSNRTLAEALQWASVSLSDYGNERNNAEILLQFQLNMSRDKLFQELQSQLSEKDWMEFQSGIQRINEGIPVQHLTGEQYFYGRKFYVTKDVLIPRPETEEMIDIYRHWQKMNQQTFRLLDLCTGSGVIAVTLKKEFPQNNVVASDISQQAILIAKKNAQFHDAQIEFHQGNLFEPFQKTSLKFDCILSNPPYLSHEEFQQISTRVTHDPRIALDGGRDGLDFYRSILGEVRKFIAPKGMVLFEIGHTQAEAIQTIARHVLPSSTSEVIQDIHRKNRFIKIIVS